MGEKIIVRINDLPVNVAGTKRGDLDLPFDHEPETAEIVERVQQRISIPLLVNDEEREAHLILCAFGVDPEPVSFVLPKLRLLGSVSGHAEQRKLRKRFTTKEMIKEVGKMLLRTLRAGEIQSFAQVPEFDNWRLVTVVIAHPGTFEALAPTLRGHYDAVTAFVNADERLSRPQPSALLLLDYFVEDADYEISRPFSLSLAVSFFPLKEEALPTELHIAVIHREFFTEEDLRGLGLDLGEADELRALLGREWDRTLSLHGDRNYKGVVKLWEPVASNPLFRIDHPEWEDNAHVRCQVHSVKSLLFIAHAQLGATEGTLACVASAFRLLQEVLKADPYSTADDASSGLPADWARIQNLNYVDTLDFAKSWFDGWAGMLQLMAGDVIPETGMEPLDGAEVDAAIEAVERRLRELKSVLAE